MLKDCRLLHNKFNSIFVCFVSSLLIFFLFVKCPLHLRPDEAGPMLKQREYFIQFAQNEEDEVNGSIDFNHVNYISILVNQIVNGLFKKKFP